MRLNVYIAVHYSIQYIYTTCMYFVIPPPLHQLPLPCNMTALPANVRSVCVSVRVRICVVQRRKRGRPPGDHRYRHSHALPSV